MDSRTLACAVLLIFVLLVGVGTADFTFSGAGFSTYRYTAELTPSQVFPTTCAAALNARGAGFCTLDRGARPRPVVTCEFVHNVEDATVSSIQLGFPGAEAQDTLFQFPEQDLYGFFEGEIIRGTFTLDEDDDEQQETAFLSGDVFINIVSSSCPGGALRGALRSDFNVYSDLRGGNEVPPIGSPDQGIAVSKYDLGTRELTSFIDHTVKDPTGAHIHQGFAGENGDILFPFADPTTQITGTDQLTVDQEDLLFREGLYYNIHSELFTAGEVRDQLRVIDAIPNANYVFQLTADAVAPSSGANAVGAALFAVDCETFEVEYIITHNVVGANRVTIETGFPETNGDILFDLNGFRSPVIGSFVADNAQYVNLVNGNLFVQVYSDDFDDGAIRGQIDPSVPFYAYLSGYQENPAVTTAARGVGLIELDSANDVTYFIQHTVDSSTAAHFHLGRVGVNGDIITEIGNSGDSPIQGDTSLSGSDADAMASGDVYINVHSLAFSSGEVRGQILPRTASCVDFQGYFSDSYYSFSDPSPGSSPRSPRSPRSPGSSDSSRSSRSSSDSSSDSSSTSSAILLAPSILAALALLIAFV